jgi:hypothetical protein
MYVHPVGRLHESIAKPAGQGTSRKYVEHFQSVFRSPPTLTVIGKTFGFFSGAFHPPELPAKLFEGIAC